MLQQLRALPACRKTEAQFPAPGDSTASSSLLRNTQPQHTHRGGENKYTKNNYLFSIDCILLSVLLSDRTEDLEKWEQMPSSSVTDWIYIHKDSEKGVHFRRKPITTTLLNLA